MNVYANLMLLFTLLLILAFSLGGFSFNDICVCGGRGLRGPLRSIWLFLTSPTSNYLLTCLLQPSLLCLSFPTQDLCTWCSFCLTHTCPKSSQEEFLLISGFSSSAVCTVGPCLKTPALFVIVSKTFYYFHRLIAIYIHTVSPRMQVSRRQRP